MVAACDIGNTNIHLGVYEGERLMKRIIFPRDERSLESKILKNFSYDNVSGAAIASVVPSLTQRLKKVFRRRFHVSPVIVTSAIDCGLTFGYRKPKTLGADRIANAAGGRARYKKNLIIIDFGTATTIDIVFKNGHFAGGIITPGIETLMHALAERTALLKKIPIKKPGRTVGASTEECIQSGVFNGAVAMVDGLIKKVRKEYRNKFLCVATGGWGKIMAQQIAGINRYDQNLCLFGILKIYYYSVT
jgi:type III pantothenate kinase